MCLSNFEARGVRKVTIGIKFIVPAGYFGPNNFASLVYNGLGYIQATQPGTRDI